jgi:hypothetical protein
MTVLVDPVAVQVGRVNALSRYTACRLPRGMERAGAGARPRRWWPQEVVAAVACL